MNVAGIGSVTGNERLLFRKVAITSLYCLCRLNVYHSYGRKKLPCDDVGVSLFLLSILGNIK